MSKFKVGEVIYNTAHGKHYEIKTLYENTCITKEGFQLVLSSCLSVTPEKQNEIMSKPEHYKKGIDSFKRMEANATNEEKKGAVKINIDKYNWRDKGQNRADLRNIIAYAEWALKNIEY